MSSTDDRGCKCRKTAGEESPGFAGQDAGKTSGGGDSKASATEIYRQCLTLSVELIGKGGKAV